MTGVFLTLDIDRDFQVRDRRRVGRKKVSVTGLVGKSLH